MIRGEIVNERCTLSSTTPRRLPNVDLHKRIHEAFGSLAVCDELKREIPNLNEKDLLTLLRGFEAVHLRRSRGGRWNDGENKEPSSEELLKMIGMFTILQTENKLLKSKISERRKRFQRNCAGRDFTPPSSPSPDSHCCDECQPRDAAAANKTNGTATEACQASQNEVCPSCGEQQEPCAQGEPRSHPPCTESKETCTDVCCDYDDDDDDDDCKKRDFRLWRERRKRRKWRKRVRKMAAKQMAEEEESGRFWRMLRGTKQVREPPPNEHICHEEFVSEKAKEDAMEPDTDVCEDDQETSSTESEMDIVARKRRQTRIMCLLSRMFYSVMFCGEEKRVCGDVCCRPERVYRPKLRKPYR